MNHEQLLRQVQLAEVLGLDVKTIQNWVARGLPGYQCPGYKRPFFTVRRTREWARRQPWLKADID